jgi:NADP-dependent 3-hydroxy acid dehydrogenase YdfG
MKLTGQVVLVTGAGGGIGRAVALRFAREGAALALASRTKSELQKVSDEVQALGQAALALPTDVTKEDQVADLVSATFERFGRLDCLVTAAGAAHFGSVRESKLDEWEAMYEANLRGVYLTCRAVFDRMTLQGHGTIINILSIAAARTISGSAGYTASKQGALGFTRILAEEARPYGIRVGALLPGAVDTPLWDAVPDAPDRTKMLRPQDVAEAACFMATQPLHVALEELRLLPIGGIL